MYEMLVGLNIKDSEVYAQYRAAMMPLLETYGGGFRYDFEIQKTLKSSSDKPINRVFAIYFRDLDAKEQFFANPQYLEIKKKFFEPSVQDRTLIAEYSRP